MESLPTTIEIVPSPEFLAFVFHTLKFAVFNGALWAIFQAL
jgi:hypothetical protein